MSMEVVDYKWYSGIRTVGFVLCLDSYTGNYACYCSCATGYSEEDDMEFIKGYGATVEQNVAEAMFKRKLTPYKK